MDITEFDLKGKAAHLGYLYWLIANYGYSITVPQSEICRRAGVTPVPLRNQLVTLEAMGYLTINRRYNPQTIEINKDRIAEELRFTPAGTYVMAREY